MRPAAQRTGLPAPIWAYPVGTAIGLVEMLFGTAGPLVVAWLSRRVADVQHMRASTPMIITVAASTVLAGMGWEGRLSSDLLWQRWLVLIASLLSPLLTHRLSYYWGFGVMLGSALPSLLVALLLALLPPSLELAPGPLAAIWLGASFVGMTAPERLAPRPVPLLLAMGLLFALLSFSFAPRLAGIGGDLGATAAVSVFAVLGVRVLDRR